MRQVPRIYIYGQGRVARHLSYYLKLLGRDSCLSSSLSEAQYILVLVSDSAILECVEKLKVSSSYSGQTFIHFSGSLDALATGVIGMHPLMTFPEPEVAGFYELKIYEQIPFVIDKGAALSLQDVFPFLPNPCYFLDEKKKALYHSLCVVGGNLSALLMIKSLELLRDELGLDPQVAHLYLARNLQNILQVKDQNYSKILTGPISRGDEETITKNKQALRELKAETGGAELANIYDLMRGLVK